MAHKKPLKDIKEVRKMYDRSFDHHRKAWRHLCMVTELVGWKDIYFMMLKLQEETNDTKNYRLRKNPKI